MKFRLTYAGELKAAGNNSNRPAEKWALREAFHPQLAELWQTHRSLKGIWQEMHQPGLEDLKRLYGSVKIGEHSFLPLIRSNAFLTCDLRILFLRKEEPGSLLLQGGDLDGRLKVLFDGLRMPSVAEVVGFRPSASPFNCLLENDSLITGFSVDTDRLLTGLDKSVHEVQLVIDASVRVVHATLENIAFLAE